MALFQRCCGRTKMIGMTTIPMRRSGVQRSHPSSSISSSSLPLSTTTTSPLSSSSFVSFSFQLFQRGPGASSITGGGVQRMVGMKSGSSMRRLRTTTTTTTTTTLWRHSCRNNSLSQTTTWAKTEFSRGSFKSSMRRSFSSSSSSSTSSSKSFFFLSLREFFTWYSKKLDTHPLTTKCISAACISSMANMLAQAIAFYKNQQPQPQQEQESQEQQPLSSWKEFVIDPHQVGRFAFMNIIFVAPVLHHWYAFLSQAIPGIGWKQVLHRTFWDEFIFAPVYLAILLGGLWGLEGTKDMDTIQTMLWNELPDIVVAEWILWVPTMLVTFRYVPVKYQVLVINCVGVFWQTFLSFMATQANDPNDHDHDPDTTATTTTTTIMNVGEEDDKTALKTTTIMPAEEESNRLQPRRNTKGELSRIYLETVVGSKSMIRRSTTQNTSGDKKAEEEESEK